MLRRTLGGESMLRRALGGESMLHCALGGESMLHCALGLSLLATLSFAPAGPAFAAPPAQDDAPAAAESADEDGAGTGFAGALRERRAGRGPMLLVLRIAEELHLSDEQTVKVAGEFRRVAQQRRELLAQKAALVTKLESQLARQPRDDGALDALTGQLVGIEQQMALLPEQLWKGVQPVLTVEQRARLILLRGKMKQQIDGARRRHGGRNGGDGGAARD
jgi:hypothetical protein